MKPVKLKSRSHMLMSVVLFLLVMAQLAGVMFGDFFRGLADGLSGQDGHAIVEKR